MRLAKYIRLSDEDDDNRSGDKTESNSISNQRALLDGFLQTHTEFASYEILEFCDDGFTGRNFERPQVQKLLEMVRSNEINVVIVKDFSRFGRNYIDVGAYLEQIFPFCGVRFISVNDHYDSAEQKYGTAGDLTVSFKNFVNDLYSKDLSQKAKIARIQYAKRGECIAADSFYGYVKDPKDHHKLIIDEEAAAVVRRIFEMRCQGINIKNIARCLNEDQTPTPLQHKKKLGTATWLWKKRDKENYWDEAAVYRILKEERYTGKAIGHTRVMADVRSKQRIKVPREEWIVVPNAHPAIIKESIFKKASEMTKSFAKEKPDEPKLFSGKMKCGECGLAMSYMKGRRPYYKCYRRGVGCSGEVKVFVDVLESGILESLRYQGRLAQSLLKRIEDKKADLEIKKRAGKTELERLREKKGKLELRKMDLFVQLDAGELTVEEYTKRSEQLTAELDRLESIMTRTELTLDTDIGQLAENEFIYAFQNAGELTTVTRPAVEHLIDRIDVFNEETIEVNWNFAEQLAQLLKILDDAEDEDGGIEHEGRKRENESGNLLEAGAGQ